MEEYSDGEWSIDTDNVLFPTTFMCYYSHDVYIYINVYIYL